MGAELPVPLCVMTHKRSPEAIEGYSETKLESADVTKMGGCWEEERS